MDWVFGVFLFGVFVFNDVDTQMSSVLDFTDADFWDKVKQHEIILVEFYAPWCGHCKKLAPEYEKAAARLQKNEPPVPLARIDCVAETKICDEFKITAYPGLKIFKNGKFSEEYTGTREANGIVHKMARLVGPISKNLTTVQEFEDFLARQGTESCVIGFFKLAKDEEKNHMSQSYEKVAEEYGDLMFAHTFTKAVRKHARYKDAIVMYRPKVMANKFEQSEVSFDASLDGNTLKLHFDMQRFGLCGHRNAINHEKFKKPLFVAFYDVDFVRNPKGTNYWRNRIMKVAQKIQEQRVAYFAVSNKDEHSYEMENCGHADYIGTKPVVCGYDEHQRKFKMEKEFTMENFEAFVMGVLRSEVYPYIKSEQPPKKNDQPLKKVVAKTFQAIVNDPDKDVLIEFYAPWCAHCKELAPKYKRVAETFKNEPNIVVAKFDATSNDAPAPFEIKGFPDIYFVPKDGKSKPQRYTGPREVKELIQFVAEEATDELIGFDRYGKKKDSKTEL